MKRWIIAGAILVALLIVAAVGWFGTKAYVLNAKAGEAGNEAVVLIPRGASVRSAAAILNKAGVLDKPMMMVIAARLTSGQGHIQAGEFKLGGNQTIGEILHDLRSGKVMLHTVVLPEGLTMAETIGRLAQAGVVDKARAEALCRDEAFIHSLGLPGPTLEGYLFPETYHFAKNLGERRVLGELVQRFCNAYEKASANAPETGLDMRQSVILASIVEAEAQLAEERVLVSAVYHNRLKKGMRLEADPTVIYGLGGLDRPLWRKDLRIDTPYNTYIHFGLPPGPICNPGLASLWAATHPAQVDYLFFVAKGDGGHKFSSTYRGQVNAINKYRRR